MQFLLNEDELRTTAFVLIYNVRDDSTAQSSHGVVTASEKNAKSATSEAEKEAGYGASGTWGPWESAIREILEVDQIWSAPQHKRRFWEHRMNVASIEAAHLSEW